MSELKVGDTVMIVQDGDGRWAGEIGTVAQIAYVGPADGLNILLFREVPTARQGVWWWDESRLKDFGLREIHRKGFYQWAPAGALMVVESKENDED